MLEKGGISVLQTSIFVGRLFQWYHTMSLTFDLAQSQICFSYSRDFQFYMYVSTSLLYRAVPAGCREHPSDDREWLPNSSPNDASPDHTSRGVRASFPQNQAPGQQGGHGVPLSVPPLHEPPCGLPHTNDTGHHVSLPGTDGWQPRCPEDVAPPLTQHLPPRREALPWGMDAEAAGSQQSFKNVISSPDHKCLENYCHSPNVVVICIIRRQKF